MTATMPRTTSVQAIEERRREVVALLLAMRSMVRGALTEQFLKVPHKGKDEPALLGPYYVLSRSVKGRTQSSRVKKKEVEQVRLGVDNYKRFESLCTEFAELTERLGELEHEAGASESDLKKKPKLRSNRAKKSSES